MLEIKYEGTTDKEASTYIGHNLEYARKCRFFESQMSVPVFSSMMGNAEPNLDLKRDLSKEMLVRDIQKGKSKSECMTNFAANLIRENMEN
jgi:hypothetical protein